MHEAPKHTDQQTNLSVWNYIGKHQRVIDFECHASMLSQVGHTTAVPCITLRTERQGGNAETLRGLNNNI